MSKMCVFTRSKKNFPTMEELRIATFRDPNIPIIIKISDTGENFIYRDGVYPLIDVEEKEIKLEENNKADEVE